MDEQNGTSPGPAEPAAPDSIITMRNIWKTYQMGVEELHAFSMSDAPRASIERDNALALFPRLAGL